MSTLDNKSKELAFLLRHDTDYEWNGQGWRKVSDLILNHNFTEDELEEIVATDNKGRYEFSDDHQSVRARQGHSIPVDVGLKETVPPDILYHGTATRFWDSIWNEGIKKMSRQYVHLSKDYDTALSVGKRHSHSEPPLILTIDARKMHQDGIKFYLSTNGVWLTDYVDRKYFITR